MSAPRLRLRVVLLSCLTQLCLIAPAASSTVSSPLGTIRVRPAAFHELDDVAVLQLDTFSPEPDAPPLLPMLQTLYEANQRAARAGMRSRLAKDLETRALKGSDILVAVQDELDDDGKEASCGEVDEAGQYVERGAPLLGTVDLSTQEIQLPTHALASGLYLSHMAVASFARRLVRRGSHLMTLAVARSSLASLDPFLTAMPLTIGSLPVGTASRARCSTRRQPAASSGASDSSTCTWSLPTGLPSRCTRRAASAARLTCRHMLLSPAPSTCRTVRCSTSRILMGTRLRT